MLLLLSPVPQPTEMFDIVQELLLEANFNNKVSVTTFVRETVSSLEAALISSGTAVVACGTIVWSRCADNADTSFLYRYYRQ